MFQNRDSDNLPKENNHTQSSKHLYDDQFSKIVNICLEESSDLDKSHKKKKLKQIIFDEIKNHIRELNEIKNKIEESFQQSISYTDEAYIEQKFLKYCSKFWLEDLAKEITDVKYTHTIQEVAYSIHTIQIIGDIPPSLTQSKYYRLLKKHSNLFILQEEKNILSQVQNLCIKQIFEFDGSAKLELQFLKSFDICLSSSSDLQRIIAELDLIHFNKDELSCDNLLKNINVFCKDSYSTLKTTAKYLEKVEKSSFFIDKIKRVVADYLEPVKIQILDIDNRQIIEIKSKSFNISEVLPQVEDLLKKNIQVEEVCFVASNNIIVDENLRQEIWHGKNVVALTKNFIVKDNIIWNVSGNSNNKVFPSDAGTATNGDGKQGQDGDAGESGGNVLILVEELVNLKNLTVKCNGGQGGKGQDGGNGQDGKDGVGISRVDLDEKFPSVIKFASDRAERRSKVRKMIETIKSHSETIKKEWYADSSNPTYDHMYIKGFTSEGNKIVFSSCHGSLTCRYQSFLLYTGSSGQAGKHGGEYGLGGQGGFAGEVKINNIISNQNYNVEKECTAGQDGENGKGGLYGKHGKQGWDMGWKDYQFWADTVYYGRNKDSKIKLVYWNNNSSERIWCPYKANRGKNYVFADMEAIKIENKEEKQYKERKTNRQSDNRKQNAAAVRKKTISKGNIINRYSHFLTPTESTVVQSLRLEVENTDISSLQAIVENQEQYSKETLETKTKRFTPHSFCKQKKRISNDQQICMILNNPRISNVEMLRFLQKTPLAENWYKLKLSQLNLSELKQIYTLFDSSKNENKFKLTDMTEIESFLFKKYRLAILPEIATLLPDINSLEKENKEMISSESKYLINDLARDNNITNEILGTLNQYFFENNKTHREKISKYCKEKLYKTKSDILNRSLKLYILEYGHLDDTHSKIKKYYNDYENFSEKQLRNMGDCFDVLKGELFRPRHTKAFELWIESMTNNVKTNDFENVIQKDVFLNFLYTTWKIKCNSKFDWSSCYTNKDVYKSYDKCIREKGPMSKCYRELLALIFHINIKLYTKDENNEYVLKDNHNSVSKKTIYLLLKNNEFLELDIDKDYLHLEAIRKIKDKSYSKLLPCIFSLNTRYEVDDYYKNKKFLDDINKNQLKIDCIKLSLIEQENIDKIAEYFILEEKQEIKLRLQKISYLYIGQHNIIFNILERFQCDGEHVSFQEMCYIINLVLTSFNQNREEKNIFSWIIASYSQENWLAELVLFQLESYFRKKTDEMFIWREYLKKINRNISLLLGLKLCEAHSGTISVQCITEIFYLLSNIGNSTLNLINLELSEWSYALKEQYWIRRLEKIMAWEESELAIASYYLLSVENLFGTFVTQKFLDILETKRKNLSPSILITILSNYHDEKWNLSNVELKLLQTYNIAEWISKMHDKFIVTDKDRDIEQIAELVQSNSNTSSSITDKLETIVNEIKMINYGLEINKKAVENFSEKDIEMWAKEFRNNHQNQINDKTNTQMLAIIDRAVSLKNNFKLRDTQRFTILTLFANNCSTLAQVSTGEGKSLIVVAASIMKALYGEKVDIITSSSLLAIRDAKCNKEIYNMFGINVSHNCSEDIEKRKEAYSNNTVIYGDLSNFQRDYLLDRFYGKNILGDHTFTNVIVDEVDSMLLDKGNNMLYLSHDIAGLDKLESVYIYIWRWINRPVGDYEQIKKSFDVKAIKREVLLNLYHFFNVEDIGNIETTLNNQQKKQIWDRLLKAKIIDNQSKILKTAVNDDLQVLSPEFIHLKDRIKYVIMECENKINHIHVPNYLKPFIEEHLDLWINSAIAAFCMKAGQDYVVDVDRTGASSDRNANITIIDRDTGTDQANSQWDEALHQFLQLKHGCKISMQSLKAVFISNVSFFKLYRNLYGLTGTLGSQRERDLLKDVHKVDFVTVPTAKTKQFHEYTPISCVEEKEWINQIYKSATDFIEKKQSVLIICQTVEEVESLYKYFQQKGQTHVHTYTRDYEEFKVIQSNKKLEVGQIIMATNLAGRGTDIKISGELNDFGGLHVCLTYLPNNVRVEQQAFGRAARNGDKGSGQLVILNAKSKNNSNSEIMILKKERDSEELHRISNIKNYYETHITVEETCFDMFKKVYEKIQHKLSNDKVPDEVKLILLQSCIDKWAFWLDKNNKYIKSLQDFEVKKQFDDSMEQFLTDLSNLETGYSTKWFLFSNQDNTCWFKWVEQNPLKMLQLGKYFLKTENYREATLIFDYIIQLENEFSEAAHYFKAFALSKTSNWNPKSSNKQEKENFKRIKKELYFATMLFNKHSETAIFNAGIIDEIKSNYDKSIIEVNAYNEQQKNISDIYQMFLRSIDDILGHSVTPQAFTDHIINDYLSEAIYEDLLTNGILNKPKVKNTILNENLTTISTDYGISINVLRDFISQFKRKSIDEKVFHQALKAQIQLPNRETFWKLLIDQKILKNEVKYIIIDTKKLMEIDPSLLTSINDKIKKEQLIKQTLNAENGEVFLNVEKLKQQENDSNLIFRKDEFKIIIDSKYTKLKKNRVLTSNRKAVLDVNDTKNTTFSCYDSISLDDFNKLNINSSDVDKILMHLVTDGILEKSNENSCIYKLKVEYEKITSIKIPFSPIYDDNVKRLLFICFSYRVALQKMLKQLQNEIFPISIKLLSKPHLNLMFDLVEQKVIKPASVNMENNSEGIENKLKQLYSPVMNKQNFVKLFSESELFLEQSSQKLVDYLIEKRWILKYDAIQTVHEKGWSSLNMSNFENAAISILEDLYFINASLDTRLPLDNCYKNIEESLKTLLNYKLITGREDTIQNIVKILDSLKSTAKALNVPDSKLNPLSYISGLDKFSNVEEIYIMYLNGLDLVHQLEEKKWTGMMIFKTIVVIIMGIVQIAIGTAIQLYSVGLLTHVGSAFINEGINDMFFAASALKSGYFSWNDYFKNKFQSILLSTITMGIGAYFSHGTKVSKFGQKLFGPGINIGGQKAAEISGKQLINIVGTDVIYKQVAKNITLKTVQGVAFGMANVSIDFLIDKCLKKVCEGISSQILLDIDKEVCNHNLSKTIEEIYKILGYKGAKKLVSTVTEKHMTKQSYVEQILPIMINIASSVTCGVAEAIKKRRMTNNPLDLPMSTISNILLWVGRISQIATLNAVTIDFLNDLDQDVKTQLNELREKNNKPIDVNQENDVDFETFRKEMNDSWKLALRQKAGQVITQHIVSPVLKDCANCLIRYFGNYIKKRYKDNKESNIIAAFIDLKQQYQEDLDNIRKTEEKGPETEKIITKKYHQDLLELRKKTRNPILLAAIIKENVPMDITCVSACGHVVNAMFKERGINIPDLTFVVKAEGGISQEFCTGTGNAEKVIISLQLIDNHFSLSGSDASLTNGENDIQNNCLYEALVMAIPQLRDIMTPDLFRDQIAYCIEHNEEIRHHILQGWHQAELSLGLFGGAKKKKSDVFHDEESSTFNEETDTYKEFLHRERKVSNHLVARFLRYVRFTGVIQRGSEETDIPREEMVIGGASEFQDQHSNRGRSIQASHLVRGKMGEQLKTLPKSRVYKEIRNVMGHTQNISIYGNEFHSIGGDLDKLQSNSFSKMAYIDYSTSITLEDVQIIEGLKQSFLERLDYRITRQNLTESQRNELREARNRISNLSYETIYKKGQEGYKGTKPKRYF